MAGTGVERVLAPPSSEIAAMLVRPVTGFESLRPRQPIPVLPSPTVTVMLQIGDPFDGTPAAFIAGPRMAPLAVTCRGLIACIDVKLSPIAATALFGPVLHELAGRTESLADVVPGTPWALLLEELASAPDWPGRLARTQRFLGELSRCPHAVDDRLRLAWSHLQRLDGTPRISELAGASGWSHRHFVEQFRRYTGLTPKSAAQLLRVERAMRVLRGRASLPLAQVALSCGYADQAHMSRDLLRFTGSSPDRFRRDPRLVTVGAVPSASEPLPEEHPR